MSFDPVLLTARHAGPAFLRVLGRSWRYREIGWDGEPAESQHRAGPFIYALWHAQLLPLTVRHLDQNLAVIVSRHRDGEIIARIIAGLGYRPVRGSSTRGGAAALRELARAAEEGHPLALTTDGPRGPARRCKPGAVRAASATGLPVVPAAAAVRRAWRFRGWDEFLLPQPGSLICVTYGAPIPIPPGIDRLDIPGWQDRITEAQNEATRRCQETLARMTGRSGR